MKIPRMSLYALAQARMMWHSPESQRMNAEGQSAMECCGHMRYCLRKAEGHSTIYNHRQTTKELRTTKKASVGSRLKEGMDDSRWSSSVIPTPV